MLKKTLCAAILASCGLLAVTTGAFAAQTAPAPVPFGQEINAEPAVAMSAAVKTAETAYEGRSTSARLRTAHGDLYWAVHLEKADGERIVAFVNAKTGEIASARSYGKPGDTNGRYCDGNGPRGYRGDCIDNGRRSDCRMGDGRYHRRAAGCCAY